jgi:hypothetical protein
MRRLCVILAVLVFAPAVSAAPEKAATGKLLFLGVSLNAEPEKGGSNDEWDYTSRELDAYLKRDTNGLYKQVESHLVLGKSATVPAVRHGLGWLKENARPGDLAVVAFGCHGTGDGKMFNLLMMGGPLHGAELKEALSKLPCQVLLILDCCDAADFVRKHATERTALPANVAVLCACRVGQHENVGLTIAVAEALAGKADHDGDGVVTLDEVFRYVPRRMHEFAELMKKEHFLFDGQAPVIAVPDGYNRQRPLARVSDKLVSVVRKNEWFAGELLDAKGEKPRVHLVGTGWPNEATPRQLICMPGDGKPVMVQKDGKWVAALLVRSERDRRVVKLIGKDVEETVPASQVRVPFAAGPAAPPK